MNVEQEWLTWYNALKLLYYYQIMGSKSGCLSLRAYGDTPTEGYRLAANCCENYDLRYGNSLICVMEPASMVPAVDGSQR